MHLAGPTIVTHGTDEQKARFLRPMFTGEEIWCQLFSEPGAGSDLAGLATKAVRDGDEWIVNGQKVWNTLAHLADWGMLVTRTDPDLPKHKGMTYFVVDMHSPGVEVRPLRQITGEAEFNEVYLTDVRIPDANRIGDNGEGWRVSLTTLMNERSAIGGGAAGGAKPRRGGAANEAVSVWKRLPDADRTGARKDELMRLWVRGEVCRLTNMRAAEAAKAGNPGPERSVAKLAFAKFNKRLYSCASTCSAPTASSATTTRSVGPTSSTPPAQSRVCSTRSCGARRTRSRAARRRSCATSSASRSSASPANPASTRNSPGHKFPAADMIPVVARTRWRKSCEDSVKVNDDP